MIPKTIFLFVTERVPTEEYIDPSKLIIVPRIIFVENMAEQSSFYKNYMSFYPNYIEKAKRVDKINFGVCDDDNCFQAKVKEFNDGEISKNILELCQPNNKKSDIGNCMKFINEITKNSL